MSEREGSQSKAFGAPAFADRRYADLEKPLEDVRNMADIVTQVMQHEGGLEAGDVTIGAQSWDTLLFAIYHLQELVDRLCTQYHRDGEADASTSS
jgi:hypothetical protein